MNWRRLYATVQIWAVLGGVATGGAVCWSFVIAGLCSIAFHLEENESMLLIGLPILIMLSIGFIRVLRKHLRKAGMLSDDPTEFGPWFIKHSDNKID
jgi:hypothetical protein